MRLFLAGAVPLGQNGGALAKLVPPNIAGCLKESATLQAPMGWLKAEAL